MSLGFGDDWDERLDDDDICLGISSAMRESLEYDCFSDSEVEQISNNKEESMVKDETKTYGECRYHIGMSCHLPQGTIIMLPEKEACRHFISKPKLTVFEKITESEEVLAEKLVYCEYPERFAACASWRSVILGNISFAKREEAIAATVEELKKEYKR